MPCGPPSQHLFRLLPRSPPCAALFFILPTVGWPTTRVGHHTHNVHAQAAPIHPLFLTLRLYLPHSLAVRVVFSTHCQLETCFFDGIPFPSHTFEVPFGHRIRGKGILTEEAVSLDMPVCKNCDANVTQFETEVKTATTVRNNGTVNLQAAEFLSCPECGYWQ